MTTTNGHQTFINHLKRMQQDIRAFYEANKDLPKKQYEKEYSFRLKSGIARHDHVIQLVEQLDEKKLKGLDEWFKHQNRYLASYQEEPIESYTAALMLETCAMRSASDLMHEITMRPKKLFGESVTHIFIDEGAPTESHE